MSLYYVQKLMYNLNRDPVLQVGFKRDPNAVLSHYRLSPAEKEALLEPDIGLLYVMGVNGQILMHYAALYNIAWPDYLQAMRDGIDKYGPVKTGLYTMSETGKESRTSP